MKQAELKDMMADFENLIDNAWYYVRTKSCTSLPGEQEKNEAYIKELHSKWEKRLNERFVMDDDNAS